jgi:hypothetical protein
MTNPIMDRSAPGVRITLLPNEKASSGEPVDLADFEPPLPARQDAVQLGRVVPAGGQVVEVAAFPQR